MNEVTKHLFVKIYLQQVSNADYVDWAINCLEGGFDSKNLRLLAGLNKNHSIEADYEEHFRNSLSELNWKYLDERVVLLSPPTEIG